MSITTPTLAPPTKSPLVSGRLPRVAQPLVLIGALVLGAVVWLPFGRPSPVAWAITSMVFYAMAIGIVSGLVEGKRHAVDRVATGVVTSAFILVLMPLVSLVWTVFDNGRVRLDTQFFTDTMRNVVGEGGGAYHAIVGTLIITGLAALMSVPFGVFTSIYLVEYGRGRLARMITAMVDVMTGIPSIVAGLFAYALFALFWGSGTRSGISGAVALTVLMTPVVVRSSEEMLRLVPNELREASLALGVPKWKTVVKVVLPTAIAGILTGVTLAIARVVGETAPLLVTAGLAQDTNYNPFSGRMTTLPVYTYYQYTQPGVPPDAGQNRAWTAALTLIIIVAILFTGARVLASILKPKGLR